MKPLQTTDLNDFSEELIINGGCGQLSEILQLTNALVRFSFAPKIELSLIFRNFL
jgi:hypothetical protein